MKMSARLSLMVLGGFFCFASAQLDDHQRWRFSEIDCFNMQHVCEGLFDVKVATMEKIHLRPLARSGIPVKGFANGVIPLSQASLYQSKLADLVQAASRVELTNSSVSDGLWLPGVAYRAACAAIVTNPHYFRNFRRIKEYTAIVEHIGSPDPTVAYFTNRNSQWILDYVHIFKSSDSIGNPFPVPRGSEFTTLTRQTLDYVSQLADMLRGDVLPPFADILEIGVGYGGLSKIVQDLLPVNSYTLLDLPEPLALASKFLSSFPAYKSRSIFLDPTTEQGLSRDRVLLRYDTCISTYAFSELDLDWRTLYWDKLLQHCDAGFILDNSLCIEQHQSRDDYLLYPSLVQKLKANGKAVLQEQGNEQGLFNPDCPVYKVFWTTPLN